MCTELWHDCCIKLCMTALQLYTLAPMIQADARDAYLMALFMGITYLTT